MKDQEKEKPDGDWTPSDFEVPSGETARASIPGDLVHRKPERGPLSRVAELATSLALEDGHAGTYTAHAGTVYWRDGEHSEAVATRVDDVLVFEEGGWVTHEPLALAAELHSGTEPVIPEGVRR